MGAGAQWSGSGLNPVLCSAQLLDASRSEETRDGPGSCPTVYFLSTSLGEGVRLIQYIAYTDTSKRRLDGLLSYCYKIRHCKTIYN